MWVDDVMNYVVEKLKELLLAAENFGGQLVDWVDKVFPPETRGEKIQHWLLVAAPFLIAAAALIMLICCCFRCCCGGAGGRVKMMKAPGRNCRMPRNAFESDPRGYFRRLRAHPGDELC